MRAFSQFSICSIIGNSLQYRKFEIDTTHTNCVFFAFLHHEKFLLYLFPKKLFCTTKVLFQSSLMFEQHLTIIVILRFLYEYVSLINLNENDYN